MNPVKAFEFPYQHEKLIILRLPLYRIPVNKCENENLPQFFFD